MSDKDARPWLITSEKKVKITKVEIKDQMIRKEVTTTRSIIQNNECIWITRYVVEQPTNADLVRCSLVDEDRGGGLE